MKRILWFLVLILFTISFSGCNLMNKVIQHPAPALKVDNSYFANLGCFDNPSCLPDELLNLEHPIERISQPADILGGLDPALPLAVVSTYGFNPEEAFPSVYVHRCMVQNYVRYLVQVNGKIRLLDSIEGLASIYAPIESSDEALSYAVAATGFSAVYDMHQNRKLKFYVDAPEETFVRETNDGYVVHLFDTFLCGCGPHIISSVDVSVSFDGAISLSEPMQTYSDPELDGLCID